MAALGRKGCKRLIPRTLARTLKRFQYGLTTYLHVLSSFLRPRMRAALSEMRRRTALDTLKRGADKAPGGTGKWAGAGKRQCAASCSNWILTATIVHASAELVHAVRYTENMYCFVYKPPKGAQKWLTAHACKTKLLGSSPPSLCMLPRSL